MTDLTDLPILDVTKLGRDHTLPLNEVFGPTWQGEGPHTGRRCWFVRLGLCNLSCSWCDTPYTWDGRRYDLKAENPETDPAMILGRLLELEAPMGSMVVVSGGEPLMHAGRGSMRLLLDPALFEWHVETNGTLAPPAWWTDQVRHTTVSPKIAQTDDPLSKRIKPKALAAWAELAHHGEAAFKFVVRPGQVVADLNAVLALIEDLDLCDDHVWIMPEGTTAGEVLMGTRTIAPAVEAAGLNLSTRLHTLLWGNERGR